MTRALWIGRHLFLGRVEIGRVSGEWQTPGPRGERWVGISLLPGARSILGPFADETTAREMVLKSANSRVKAMFGAGIETTATAAQEGRKLRTVARAIWRAGVWSCDRRIDAKRLFDDLAFAVGLDPKDAPKRIINDAPGETFTSDTPANFKPSPLQASASDTEIPEPDADFDFIERDSHEL